MATTDQRHHLLSNDAIANKENNSSNNNTSNNTSTSSRLNKNNPSAWLQLINHELASVGGDIKKCVNLGKLFETARQSITKEYYFSEDCISLCLGHARFLMYVQYKKEEKEMKLIHNVVRHQTMKIAKNY